MYACINKLERTLLKIILVSLDTRTKKQRQTKRQKIQTTEYKTPKNTKLT